MGVEVTVGILRLRRDLRFALAVASLCMTMRLRDTTDSNFALAGLGSRSYAFQYDHSLAEGHAHLSLYLLRICVFWCGEAEPLAITFSPNDWQPTAGRPGRWVFHFLGHRRCSVGLDGAVAKW